MKTDNTQNAEINTDHIGSTILEDIVWEATTTERGNMKKDLSDFIESELVDFRSNILDETWIQIDGTFHTYDKDIVLNNIRNLIKRVIKKIDER